MTVYVVIANEEERVKECEVFAHLDAAQARKRRHMQAYGGANVALASRHVLGTTIEDAEKALAGAALSWGTLRTELDEGKNTPEAVEEAAQELLAAVRAYWATLPSLPPFES